MTLDQIKASVNRGDIVHWSNELYTVKRATNSEYLIVCSSNNHCIGLTHQDNVTMNGKESEFYVKE